jgi:hypothetical protein
MSESPTLFIGRCSFWPEARDPEAWLRALAKLEAEGQKPGAKWTSPRTVGNTVLRGTISRRAVPGLFGLEPNKTASVLHGVGFLEHGEESKTWHLVDAALGFTRCWREGNKERALNLLAEHLLRRSVWLRLALLRIRDGTWGIKSWRKLHGSNAQLKLRDACSAQSPESWLKGIEEKALGAWWPEVSANQACLQVIIRAPKTKKPEDGLSISPLKSPFYLLDSLGWLNETGCLRLPAQLAGDPELAVLCGQMESLTRLLQAECEKIADSRGAFALEPAMLKFGQVTGVFPTASRTDSEFIAWTDQLLSTAIEAGAIELLSAEPGQPRHGRGLFGNSKKQLVRWRIHPEFDEICRTISSRFNRQAEGVFAL